MARWTIVLAALCAVLAPAGVETQTIPESPQLPDFGAEVEVTVVNIDVFVRDRHGLPVTGLTKEDFRILQNGVEMPISNFSAYSGGMRAAPQAQAAESPNSLSPVASTRPTYVLLYVDSEYIQPIHRTRTLNQVAPFVDRTLHHPVRMAVASARRSMAVHQDFTDDARKVQRALHAVAGEGSSWSARDSQRRFILHEMHNNPAFTRSMAKRAILSFIQEETAVLRDSMAALGQAISYLEHYEGRRSIILISGGSPMSPGRGLVEEYATLYDDPYVLTEVPLFHKGREYRGLSLKAAGSHVQISALETSGLDSPEGSQAQESYSLQARTAWTIVANRQETLRYVTDTTGGLAVLNTNDASNGLDLIRDDLLTYYSIGYTIDSRTLENDLKIAVKLPNHRTYSVRHQRWIAENPASDRIEKLLRSALGGAVGPNPIGLEVEVGVPPEVGAEIVRVPLDLVIPTAALTMKRRGDEWIGRIRLHVATRDDQGSEMDPWHHDHEIRIPEAEVNDPHDAQYRLSLEFVVRNRYQIVAVAVVDLATSESSFVRTVLHRSD